MLEIRDLRKTYKTKEESVWAFQGVDLTVKAGDFVVILGPSGCGKTTLLNIVVELTLKTKEKSFLRESLYIRKVNGNAAFYVATKSP